MEVRDTGLTSVGQLSWKHFVATILMGKLGLQGLKCGFSSPFILVPKGPLPPRCLGQGAPGMRSFCLPFVYLPCLPDDCTYTRAGGGGASVTCAVVYVVTLLGLEGTEPLVFGGLEDKGWVSGQSRDERGLWHCSPSRFFSAFPVVFPDCQEIRLGRRTQVILLCLGCPAPGPWHLRAQEVMPLWLQISHSKALKSLLPAQHLV